MGGGSGNGKFKGTKGGRIQVSKKKCIKLAIILENTDAVWDITAKRNMIMPHEPLLKNIKIIPMLKYIGGFGTDEGILMENGKE